MLSSWKLALGQSLRAWREYPALRRRVREFEPGPPILVTGMYRSGTTWTGAMLSAPGLWHLHEPFNPNRGVWSRELEYVGDSEERPDVDRFVAALLAGRHRHLLRLPSAHRWFLPLRLLPLEPKRALLKDPSAALMSEYLTRRFGMTTLVVVRHPAGVVGSFARLGWPTGALVRGLRDSRPLMEEWLHPFEDAMDAAVGRDDLYSGTVLYGCVARVLAGYLERNPGSMRLLRFEDLCRDPLRRFRDIYASLGLVHDRVVRSMQRDLCFPEEPASKYRPHEVRRSSASMADRWRDDLDRDEVRAVREAWASMGSPFYDDEAAWATEEPTRRE